MVCIRKIAAAWAFASAVACGASPGGELVDPKGAFGTAEHTIAAGKSLGAQIPLPPDAGAVRVMTRQRTEGIVVGREDWMDGHLTLCFRDGDGKMLGGWLPTLYLSGTRGWTDFDRVYVVPKGAAALYVSESNHGTAGTVTFGPVSVKVVRSRMAHAENLPVPEGVVGDPESIEDAWRFAGRTRMRVSLNGLWRARPVVPGEKASTVPGKDDAWGWGKIPGVWQRPWDFSSRGQEFHLSRWWEERGIKIDVERQNEWWYRRTFVVPRQAAGRRVLLTFTGLATWARVFVDGTPAGEVTFPGGTVDLTTLAKPGRTQTLALHVTGYPQEKETLNFNAPDRMDKLTSVVKFRGVTGDLYLDILPQGPHVADAWTETSVQKGEIRFGVNIVGVKQGERFSVSADVSGLGDHAVFSGEGAADADGVVRISSPWRDAKLWDTHTPENLYTARVSIARAGSPAAVLDEASPFRFGFREIEVNGRDVLLNGKRIHLRALTCASMVRGADRACKSAALDTCRRMRDMGFNFAISDNYDLQPGAFSYLDATLDACDETGLLLAFTMPHIKDFGDRFMDRPENAARYRRFAAWALGRMRRHPSVIAMAISHNSVGYTGDQNPLRMDGTYDPTPPDRTPSHDWGLQRRRAARAAADILRELDPTRIVYHHASGALGDFHTTNIYLNWAPIQERSDWLHDWAARGTKPMFFCEWGCPHVASWSSYRGPQFIWRYPAFHSLWVQEYAAAFRGDAAYEGNGMVARALALEEELWSAGLPFMFSRLTGIVSDWESNCQDVVGRHLEDNWRSHRAWGVTAMLPWDVRQFHRRTVRAGRARPFQHRYTRLKEPGIVPDVLTDGEDWLENGYFYDNGPRENYRPTAMGRAFERWNKEDCAFIAGAGTFTDKRHMFRIGENAEKTLVILNDRREDQSVGWAWEVVDGRRRAVASGSGETQVPAGGRRDVRLRFAMPAAGDYRLVARFAFEGGREQRDAFRLTALAGRTSPQRRELLLYDTKGLTRSHFDRLGIRYRVIETLSPSVLSNGQAIVIGRESLTLDAYDRTVRWFMRHPYRTWNDWHGEILVFEQREEVLNQLGFRTQVFGLRNAFPRSVAGLSLDGELLRDWAGEATLTPPYLDGVEDPETDYTRSAWAGFSQARVWRCRNRGNVASVLMEKPSVGDWKAFCDGAFDLQYSPLLEMTAARGSVIFCQLDVTGRTIPDPAADDITRQLVARLAGEPATSPSDVKAYGTQAFMAVRDSGFHSNQDPAFGGDRVFVVSAGAKKPKGLDDKVRNGAKVLCLGLTASEVAAWSPVPLAIAHTNECVYSRIEEPPPELDGLSDADWAWHGRMSFDAFQIPAKDGNAAFRVVRLGKGAYLFWQVPPWAIDAEAKPYLRHTRKHAHIMLSRILGNLGARCMETSAHYADAPIPEDDPYRYYRW